MQIKPQSGRSMVEILGVLAIIGVLSVGGIAGYRTAMTRMQVNAALKVADLFVLSVDEMTDKGTAETPYDTYDMNKLATFFCSYLGSNCSVKAETISVYGGPVSRYLGTYEGTKFMVERTASSVGLMVVGDARICRPFLEGVTAAHKDQLYAEKAYTNLMNNRYAKDKLSNLLKECDGMVKRGFSGAFGFSLPWAPLEDESTGG